MNTILTLQVTPTAALTSIPSDYTFDDKGGSIGRNTASTWVLPDSAKYLSGQHAVIDYNNGRYHLTDTSTNGVFVNHSTNALGRGNSVALTAGDILQMGPYQIKVALTESPSVPLVTDDPDDIFADIATPRVAPHFPENPVASFDEPEVSISTPPTNPSISVSASTFSEKEDGAALEERWWSSSSNNNSSAHPSSNGLDDFDRLFNGIGDDHDRFHEDREETPAIADTGIFPDVEHAVAPVVKDPFEQEVKINTAPTSTEVSTEQEKISDDEALTETKLIRPKPSLPPTQKPRSTSNKSSVRNQSDDKPLKRKENTANTLNTDVDAMKSFLKGVGIDDSEVQTRIATHLDFEALGGMFKTSVKGTIDVLRSRTDIKSEMRVGEMTTIQPIQNNPLKFSISLEDTLIRLMTAQKEDYMTPERAMTEAYDDIRAHQIAVMAGVQATLHTLLRRFQPNNLTQRLEKENPITANIPFHRQAKLWKHFESLYETIEHEAEEDFNRLFGAEFAKAYEQQIIHLKGKG